MLEEFAAVPKCPHLLLIPPFRTNSISKYSSHSSVITAVLSLAPFIPQKIGPYTLVFIKLHHHLAHR